MPVSTIIFRQLLLMKAIFEIIFDISHTCRKINVLSKERPGSIVTKTLKNGILIPIATSKELHFNADFK